MNATPPRGLPNFADLLLDAVFLVDEHGRIVHVTAACERILGYTPDEMIGREMMGFVAPEDRDRTREESRHVIAGLPRIGFENRYVRKDGRLADIMWSARWSEADRLRIGVARDVTQRKRAEARQAATYAISEAAHVAVDLPTLFRDIHRVVGASIPAAGFTVALREEETGAIEFPYSYCHHDDAAPAHDLVARRIGAEAVRLGRTICLPDDSPAFHPRSDAAPDDAPSWLAMPLLSQGRAIGAIVVKSRSDMPCREGDRELLHFVAEQAGIAIERRRLHAALLNMARFDELTGLPNRRHLHDRLAQALGRARRAQGRLAVLYIDLDKFKEINDSLGHAAGDLLLQAVAQRLQQSVRDTDTVARLGGDEFVVVAEQVDQPEAAARIAENIRAAISAGMTIAGRVLHMMPSIGIAIHPDHGSDAAQLLEHADKAMYEDKRIRIPPAWQGG